MTVRVCSHRSSMQSDVLNDQQQQLSNDSDCSASLSTTLIYSGLKLHPKPLVPTISMSNMASPVSIVKKLSLADSHPDHLSKSIGSPLRHSTTSTTPSSIRLVTPTAGKSSPPTTLQLQFLDKTSTTTNGGFSTSKAFIFNPQPANLTGTSSSSASISSSNPVVTLIPPGATSPKIQTLISSTNDLSTTNDFSNLKQSPFLSKSRVTLVQPIITNASTAAASSNSVAPKLVIQQNTTSNIWPSQSTTKILSAKMLPRPVHLISSNEPTNLSSPTSNDNPIFTTKALDSGHQTFFHMSLLPSSSGTESINSIQLTNIYSNTSSVRISTAQRSMDHNNNHSVTTPIIREIQADEKAHDSTFIKNIHNKNSLKNRTRLPLQPSTQQVSSTLSPTKKHKLSEDEESCLSEPPNKIPHYESLDSSNNGKKVRKCRHKQLSKVSLENTTPNSSLTPSADIESCDRVLSRKRSSAEIATAAILSSSHIRKKRIQRKNSDEPTSNTSINYNDNHNQSHIKLEPLSVNEALTDAISDELLKRLSQDFVYMDPKTGIRWIGTKARSKPMNTLLSRFSWKPKINHYERYSDIIRMNPKRTVPTKSVDVIRQKLTQPWASWRIDRLTTYLSDLTEDEQTSQNNLSDIGQLLDQLDINDHSIRHTIGDLVDANIQRHRYFREQINQISTLLANLLDHGNTLREIGSTSKPRSTTPMPVTNLSSTPTTRRIKER